jgi:Dolichyl-phosphate-mannose-protein mannosyltransferase
MNTTKERPLIALENRIRRQTWWLALEKFWQNNKEPISMWAGFRLALLIAPMFTATLMTMGDDVLVRGVFNNPTLDRTIGSWTRWDGVIYIDIATTGYTETVRMNFYPLYPLLMRIIAFIFNPFDSANYLTLAIAGIVISSIATLVMCILMYNLVRREYNGEVARLSLFYLLIFPTGFFLWAVYTESLFLALAIGSFYAARTNRWLLAMILAGFCVLTKNQGVFVPAALLIEYAHQIGWNPRRVDRRILYFAIPAGFFGAWLGFNWLIFGDPLQFVKSQASFFRYFSFPWDTLVKAADLFEFPLTFCFVLLLFVGIWAVWKGKFRPAYLIFFAGCILQPLSFPFKDIELFSMLRFLLFIFPAFFLLALAGRRHLFFHYTYLVFCFVMYGALMTRFILWHWVA